MAAAAGPAAGHTTRWDAAAAAAAAAALAAEATAMATKTAARAAAGRAAAEAAAAGKAIKRNNSFRRSVARRRQPEDPEEAEQAAGCVFKLGAMALSVQSGEAGWGEWATKFVVLLRDVVFVFGSSKDWSAFRCFPEESLPLRGARCTVGAASAGGDACLLIESGGTKLAISGAISPSAEEAGAWHSAAQAAAAARGEAPARQAAGASREQAAGGRGGAAGGPQHLLEETRRLEARTAAAREEVAAVSAEVARIREVTARKLGDCAYVQQVEMDKLVDEIGAGGSEQGFFATRIRPYLAPAPVAVLAAQPGAASPPSPDDSLGGIDSDVDLVVGDDLGV